MKQLKQLRLFDSEEKIAPPPDNKQGMNGRRHIGFPCDIAQDMLIEDRPAHVKTCPDCQELIKKYDKIAYGEK